MRYADRYKESGFTLYGVLYASKAEAIDKLNLNSYQELQDHIRRENLGKPFIRAKDRKLKAAAEASKRRYFTEKLKQEGFTK